MNKSSHKNRATRDVLSTKEAAEICKVALSTIVYWFDKGLIEGYRTPGGHRRIFRSDLEKFMRDHQMPIRHRLDDGHVRILVISTSESLVDAIRGEVTGANGRVEWHAARSAFQAGLLVGTLRPEIVVLDLAVRGLDGAAVVDSLRGDPATRDAYLVVIGSAEESLPLESQAEAGALDLVPAPADPEVLGHLLSRQFYGKPSLSS